MKNYYYHRFLNELSHCYLDIRQFISVELIDIFIDQSYNHLN